MLSIPEDEEEEEEEELRLSELFCAVLCATLLYTVICRHTYEQFLQMNVGLSLGLTCVFCMFS